MNALHDVWEFTRQRLDQSLDGLSLAQLEWRPYEESHPTFDLVYHICGAEHYWASRLGGTDPAENEYAARLDKAVHDGFLREGTAPFGAPEFRSIAELRKAMDYTAAEVRALHKNLSQDVLDMPLLSPIGDPVTGYQGLIRLAQHAGYHTGQIWIYRMDPRFPA